MVVLHGAHPVRAGFVAHVRAHGDALSLNYKTMSQARYGASRASTTPSIICCDLYAARRVADPMGAYDTTKSLWNSTARRLFCRATRHLRRIIRSRA
jgi:hypothetical protein